MYVFYPHSVHLRACVCACDNGTKLANIFLSVDEVELSIPLLWAKFQSPMSL